MVGGLYCFGDTLSPCLRYINVVALDVVCGCADVTTSFVVEVSCAPLLRGLMDEEFFPWRRHGGPVAVKRPI